MSATPDRLAAPAQWVCRWAVLIAAGGSVLDVACGRGRHLRYLRSRGFAVTGVDRDAAALEALAGLDGVQVRAADIESGPWPFAPESFDGVIVTNYLHRPLFPQLIGALRPGGVLIYETFAAGNERYGRPTNPDHLLRSGELLERVEPLRVVAFEQGRVQRPGPAVIQRICAVRSSEAMPLPESAPEQGYLR